MKEIEMKEMKKSIHHNGNITRASNLGNVS